MPCRRDTTVQTLTLQSTVREGIIIYEDSPLVKAVKSGSVLVVDEADKAPTHVTCILKTLVESGEMHLADGRRIVSGNKINSDTSPVFRRLWCPCRQYRQVTVLAGRSYLYSEVFGAVRRDSPCRQHCQVTVVTRTCFLAKLEEMCLVDVSYQVIAVTRIYRLYSEDSGGIRRDTDGRRIVSSNYGGYRAHHLYSEHLFTPCACKMKQHSLLYMEDDLSLQHHFLC